MRDEASSTIALAGSAGDLDSHDGSADVPSPSPNESATRCATPDDKPTPAANSSASVATPPACCQGRAIAGVAAVCADNKALPGERDTFDITADAAPVTASGEVRDSVAVDDILASGSSGFDDKRAIAAGASAGPRAGAPIGHVQRRCNPRTEVGRNRHRSRSNRHRSRSNSHRSRSNTGRQSLSLSRGCHITWQTRRATRHRAMIVGAWRKLRSWQKRHRGHTRPRPRLSRIRLRLRLQQTLHGRRQARRLAPLGSSPRMLHRRQTDRQGERNSGRQLLYLRTNASRGCPRLGGWQRRKTLHLPM
jgi:hypothetical protein